MLLSFNLHRLKINEYLHFHDKGAGGVCQGSFSFNFRPVSIYHLANMSFVLTFCANFAEY